MTVVLLGNPSLPILTNDRWMEVLVNVGLSWLMDLVNQVSELT